MRTVSYSREGQLLEAITMAHGNIRLTIKIDPDKEGEHFIVTSEEAQYILSRHKLGSRVTVSTTVVVAPAALIPMEGK